MAAYQLVKARGNLPESAPTQFFVAGPEPALPQRVQWFPRTPWPAVEFLRSQVNGVATPYSNRIQGLSHDRTNWFFSSQWQIARFPLNTSLTDPAQMLRSMDVRYDPATKGVGHLGDCELFRDELVVAAEPSAGSDPVYRAMFYDAATLRLRRTYVLPRSQNGMPWAVVAADGRLVSSEFNAEKLFIHDMMKNTFEVLPLRLASNPSVSTLITRIQGATLAPDGRLYMTSDSHDSAGIYGIDLATGVVAEFTPTPRRTKVLGFNDEEVQGITYWDLGDDGQLHMAICHQFHMPWNDDGMTLRHYRMVAPAPTPIV